VSTTPISAALRRTVAERANRRCEYCGVPEDTVVAPHEPDHIIGEQHGGATHLDSLAFACFRCNRFKGPNIATLDPQTGELAPLFNPRTSKWSEHFRLNDATIEPLTPCGRGTVLLLRLNDEQRISLRAELIRQGRFIAPGS
jgi:hypothetical protein